MSKKSNLRVPFHKLHNKWVQTLLQYEGWPFYHIHWSLWMQFSRRKSLLVICKILRLFVNTLTGDDKYSLVNRDNLRQPIQMQLHQKQKPFPEFFLAISNLHWILSIFKKKMTMHFRKYWHRKMQLDNCLKNPVSEDPLKSSMINGPENCWDMNGSTFTIFIDHCKGNGVGQSLS